MIIRFFLVALLTLSTAYAESINWKQLQIPMEDAGDEGLEAVLVWPDTAGKHPLVLISHGSPRDPKSRSTMSAMNYLPMAEEFARRGFTTAIVLRRGYGHSGGDWAEGYGNCNNPDYYNAAINSADDLRAALDYLATLPEVDADHIIAIGHSAGGMATIALTADHPPKGLVAAISFAGGRGSKAADTICKEDDLIEAFAEFGKTSRVPMLWIYANNDHFFNPTLAKKLFAAFNGNGGKAKLLMMSDFGDDGHQLFSVKGISRWAPIIDDYFAKNDLTPLTTLLPLPVDASIAAPSNLSANGKKDFNKYLTDPPHKAFATSPDGAYGYATGRYDKDIATKDAINNCEKYSDKDCKVYVSS